MYGEVILDELSMKAWQSVAGRFDIDGTYTTQQRHAWRLVAAAVAHKLGHSIVLDIDDILLVARMQTGDGAVPTSWLRLTRELTDRYGANYFDVGPRIWELVRQGRLSRVEIINERGYPEALLNVTAGV